jgi:bifunctional non-homologous end joining protein LigD
MNDRIPIRPHPMLATQVAEPVDRPGWAYEEKYDGYRILAYKEGAKVTLLSRNGKNRSETFPGIAAALKSLRDETVLLDGEVVAFDPKGISRFQLLQQGGVAQAFAVFDCLFRNGRDLRRAPLSARRPELESCIPKPSKQLFLSRRLAKNGLSAFRIAKRNGLEGLVAKDTAAPYEEGRSKKWLKVKIHQEEEFVIGGFTPPRGAREHLGALLLGAYRNKDLRFVGKVGTGFSEAMLLALAKAFRPILRGSPSFVNPPREKDTTWLEPSLVAQIAFGEWTADEKLRQPVFLGLRDDKKPRDCVMPAAHGPAIVEEP